MISSFSFDLSWVCLNFSGFSILGWSRESPAENSRRLLSPASSGLLAGILVLIVLSISIEIECSVLCE
ncbi:hypothetical protein SLEP1_g22780 [Rubroshorea leprosula]|uniref:Uncharacterized protein n=1 Tax=Rubroshorea leprosula TaxID=152421 RepID=A0AAV5JKM7_9ROSI|nr:hypothetical protein SLEP1_g22780 [Rubroshorea leprosula]